MTIITCRILLVAALLLGPTGAALAAERDEGNSEPLHHRHHVAGMEIPDHGDVEFATRLGTGYHFPYGDFTVGPEFNVDLVDGEPTYVIGASFGWGF